MKLHYDAAVDALYLRLDDAPVAESEEVRPGLILDYDDRGRAVALEILNLRKQFPTADLRGVQVEMPT